MTTTSTTVKDKVCEILLNKDLLVELRLKGIVLNVRTNIIFRDIMIGEHPIMNSIGNRLSSWQLPEMTVITIPVSSDRCNYYELNSSHSAKASEWVFEEELWWDKMYDFLREAIDQ